jgi:hypothetical protein
MTQFVQGGTPVVSDAQELQSGQIPSAVPMQQPGAVAYRLNEAFQLYDPSAIAGSATSLQAAINSLSVTINTIEGQINSLQGQINTINARLTNAGIP